MFKIARAAPRNYQNYLFNRIQTSTSSIVVQNQRSSSTNETKNATTLAKRRASAAQALSQNTGTQIAEEVINLKSQINEKEAITVTKTRPIDVVTAIYKEHGISFLNDHEVCLLLKNNIIRQHQLEKICEVPLRAIAIRRQCLKLDKVLDSENLPFKSYSDYPIATKACCENMIGYMPIPVGLAGPLKINGNDIVLPLATTEGALIASTCRGAKAISLSGGCVAIQYREHMTRAPVVKFGSLLRAQEFYQYLEENFSTMKEIFESTSNHAKLISIKPIIQGRNVYIRFCATTGEAMGMNMISKGTEHVLKSLKIDSDEDSSSSGLFPDMQVISLSSNFCTDKKSSAINWIDGRGKSIVVEATIKKEVLKGVLKTSAKSLALLNKEKNLKGSALAGSIGGFNAHAANIVAAAFIATGQDPAQVVDSAACMMDYDEIEETGDLHITCTMPCMETGTIGGGTNLSAQKSAINITLDNWPERPWKQNYTNSSLLSMTIASFVMAGELSLCSSLVVGDLVQSHLKLNRIKVPSMSREIKDKSKNNDSIL